MSKINHAFEIRSWQRSGHRKPKMRAPARIGLLQTVIRTNFANINASACTLTLRIDESVIGTIR